MTKHNELTCTRVFSRLTKAGACARCDELRSGSPAREGWGDNKRRNDALRCAAIHHHYRSGECERTCGPVCVRFDP